MTRKKDTQELEKEEKERMVSLYDPTVQSFREFPVSIVKKFIESAKEAERQLEEE